MYVAAAPPSHVADTKKNRPYARRAKHTLLQTGDVAILRQAGADWLVVDRSRYALSPSLDRVYADGRYTLYRVP